MGFIETPFHGPLLLERIRDKGVAAEMLRVGDEIQRANKMGLAGIRVNGVQFEGGSMILNTSELPKDLCARCGARGRHPLIVKTEDLITYRFCSWKCGLLDAARRRIKEWRFTSGS